MISSAGRCLPSMHDLDEHNWEKQALHELKSVVERNAQRMARHLEAQGLLHDPRYVLCALTARRRLALPAIVLRPLLGESKEEKSTAFHQLTQPDRQVLFRMCQKSVDGEANREHLASALLRFTRSMQAMRKASFTPSSAAPRG